MVPETSERNFTPSSTGLSGPPSTIPGTAVLGQIVVVALAIVRLSAFVALCGGLLESVTWAVKLKLPVAVGVPVDRAGSRIERQARWQRAADN